MSVTLANGDHTEEALDYAAMEEAAYAEVEGDGDSTEQDDASEDPTAELEDVRPEAEANSFDDGADDADENQADSDADDADESDPEEGKDEGQGDEEGEGTLDDDETEDEGDSQVLSKGQAEKFEQRIRSAQGEMHNATRKAAAAVREKESLEKQLNDLQQSIDAGQAKSSKDRTVDELMEILPEETRDFLDINPEFKDIATAILEATRGDAAPKKKAASESDTDEGNANEGEISEVEQKWLDTVLEEAPDYMEIRSSKEFEEFVNSNKATVAAITNAYDNMDPRGAVKLHKSFNVWSKRRAESEAKPKPKPQRSDRPKSRNVPAPSGGNSRVKSREQLEREAEAEL